MFSFGQSQELAAKFSAISRSQAIIEFTPDGTILTANDNFLSAMGYDLEEIQGKHHRMFVDPVESQSSTYQAFWGKLNRGEYEAAEYRRYAKNGSEVWIQASYNPIFDMNGKLFKVVKFATDITSQKLATADFKGQLAAIGKVQAVIEFNLDGTVVTANDNFLSVVGYSLDEIKGKHHRMFVELEFARSAEYLQFWDELNRGQYESRVYKRIGKNGKEVWIQASYNPIFDMNGKPFKVVKFATDMTKLMSTADLADDTTRAVQSVAAATEEMSASISEIAKNMTNAKQAAGSITEKTNTSGAASVRLSQTMQSMEKIVSLIHNIAGQVNLLALNATIEAARAGEAGKGFAVVASEVKNLANQTSKATDDIAREIAAVQALSNEVASSIHDIVDGSHHVSQYVTAVAGALEEQTAVTHEISGNIQHATASVVEIRSRIREMAQG